MYSPARWTLKCTNHDCEMSSSNTVVREGFSYDSVCYSKLYNVLTENLNRFPIHKKRGEFCGSMVAIVYLAC